jgi:hypothetical protein
MGVGRCWERHFSGEPVKVLKTALLPKRRKAKNGGQATKHGGYEFSREG